MKRCVHLLMVCALAATSPAFAQSADEAVAVKIDNADKSDKDRADKDKADKNGADKDKADKGKTDKSDKAEKAEKADKADKSDKSHKSDKSDKADKADKSGSAEAAGGTAPATTAPEAATQEERDDAVLDPAQPDFTLITLPTTLRLPRNKSAFRVTHRFTRPLGDGDFGDLAEDFFGLDGGSQIGLEFRFGIWKGAQVGIQRTNDRTIQFFGEYDVKSQSASFPVGIAAYASIDGTQNFKDSYSPALGVVVSRTIAKHAAVYVSPIWVNNTNDLPHELVDDNDTFIVGVGGRVRVHGSTYFVVEVVPRVAASIRASPRPASALKSASAAIRSS